MRCCVYSRFVYDIPYIDSFIEHYLRLGFDKLIILYHDSICYDVPDALLEEVELIQVENNGNKLINEYKHLLMNDYDWVLNVDSDEFLFLDPKYSSIKEYISEKLNENDENINMFQFSWGWIHAFNPLPNDTIADYLKNYKIFPGSKDTNSNDIWVKSMTRIDCIEYMTCHNCVLNAPGIIYVDKRVEYHNDDDKTLENIGYVSDDNDSSFSKMDYLNNSRQLTLNDIIRGTEVSSHTETNETSETMNNIDNVNDIDDINDVNLLPRCYSERDNTYSEAILIHINTRNIMNAIVKGLNIHVTQVKRKRIKKFKELKKFVNGFDTSKPIYQETMKEFTRCIGYKIKFPLFCLEKEPINEKIRHLKLDTSNYKTPFCNLNYIPLHNLYHLEQLEEKMSSMYYVLDIDKFLKILSVFGSILDNTFRLPIDSLNIPVA